MYLGVPFPSPFACTLGLDWSKAHENCPNRTLCLPSSYPRYTALTFVAMDITLLTQMCILARVAAKRATSVMVELPTSVLPATTTRAGYGAVSTVALLALGAPLQIWCFQWNLLEGQASARGSSR